MFYKPFVKKELQFLSGDILYITFIVQFLSQRMDLKNQSIYKSLFNASNDAMLILKDEKIIHYNPACWRILKATSAEQILSSSPSDFSPEYQEDRQSSKEKCNKMMEICLEKGYHQFDWIHARFNGETFPAEVSLTRIEDQGQLIIFAVIRDITEWRNSEFARQAAERKLTLIAENTEDIIWIRDLKFRYTYLSPSIQRVKGYSIEEALKLRPTEAVYREDIKKAFLILKEELENEKNPKLDRNRSRRFQTREYKKDGSLIWTEHSMSFIRGDDNKPIGFIGITRDVTEQRKIIDELKRAKQQAEESDNLKSAFLANMSHEIRTPLNAILGFSDLLGDNQIDDEERSQFSSIIRRSSNQLLSIITDVFEISKLESNQTEIILKETNLKKFIGKLNQLTYSLDPEIVNGRSIEMSEIPLYFDQEYLIDSERIEQIITNLIDNAFKFSLEGNIKLKVHHQSNGFVRFIVIDQGLGIPIEDQEFIFQRFRQAHESFDRKFGGTGLGLAICKGLVELMGGDIGVNSEPGKGAAFWFTCPLTKK